jgi:exodeoxyribonuclease VII small subunit
MISPMAKKQPATPPPQPAPADFESAVAELEQILAAMEGDQIGLEESLTRYERGTYLLGWCRDVLGQAERKIESLTQGPDGKPVTVPLDPQDEEA